MRTVFYALLGYAADTCTCCGSGFFFLKNSTHSLREGRARAVLTGESGHYSTHPWYPASTCSVPVLPEEHRNLDWCGR